MSFCDPPPPRWVCASAGRMSASASELSSITVIRMSGRMLHPLEPGIEIDLQRIDDVGRQIDGIRTLVTHAHPYLLAEPVIREQIVALGIGAAEMEIRVGIGVDDGVALQVSITEQRAPGARGQH